MSHSLSQFKNEISHYFKHIFCSTNLFSLLSISILLTMLVMPLFVNSSGVNLITFALLINGLFGIVMLWMTMNDAPYSLKQVHWIFFVTFFAIAPLFQYTSGIWPWGYSPSDLMVLKTCVLVFIWGAIFAFVSGQTKTSMKKIGFDITDASNTQLTFKLTPFARALLPIGCVVCLIVLVRVIGLDNMFLRTTNKADVGSSSLSLIISVCFRAFEFGSFILLLLDAKKEHGHYSGVVIAGLCLLLTCFPTALARFNVAAIYLGIAIFIFSIFSKQRGLFAFILIIGFLIAYPLFNAFKYIGLAASLQDGLSTIAASMTAGYTSGNYDAFSVMFWCFDYLSQFGCTYGTQLIGALLFFIPRSIWPSKPVPSGELVFTALQFHFTDIAFPLPFEGCLNFGLIGLPLFALVYGFIVRVLDRRYWVARLLHKDGVPTTLLLYYPFLLCLTFYMLRGAMMTTFTFVFGDLAVMYLLQLIAKAPFLSKSRLLKKFIDRSCPK